MHNGAKRVLPESRRGNSLRTRESEHERLHDGVFRASAHDDGYCASGRNCREKIVEDGLNRALKEKRE